MISQRASTDLKEHGQGGDPPSFPDGGIQTSGVVWIVTEDLHLNIGGGETTRSSAPPVVDKYTMDKCAGGKTAHLQRVFHPVQAVLRPIGRRVAVPPVEGDGTDAEPGAQPSSAHEEVSFHAEGH